MGRWSVGICAWGLVLGVGIGAARANALTDCLRGDGEVALRGCTKVIEDGRVGDTGLGTSDLAMVHDLRARRLQAVGRSEEAMADFQRAFDLDRTMIHSLAARASLLAEARRLDEALADIEKALGLRQDLAGLYDLRARIRRFRGELPASIADFTTAIGIDPHPALYNARGSTHLMAKDYDKALADFDKAVELSPDFWVAYTNRGAALHGKGDYAAAVESIDKAIALVPNNAYSYGARAQANLKLGQAEDALRDCDKAIALKADFSICHYVRGQANEALGRKDAAIADYRRHVELTPGSTEGKAALERLGAKQ